MIQKRTDMTLDEQIAYLGKGAAEIITKPELRAKLKKSEQTGQPLTVKVGFDPTAPDLHLGHTVLIRKMKHFQDLGHRVIFLIGDFTGLIGDPTGRSRTRPALTPEQIEENAETYKNQVFKILDPDQTVVDFNSRWLGKLTSQEWIGLSAKYTVARMLEWDNFSQRMASQQPIFIHELLYPLAQAYDSVFLEADFELGGTDQKFNLLVGRDIQREFGMEAQVLLMTPLLEGLDGIEKMSKSLDNYVGITEAPAEMYGKIMSISDDLMWRYYELLTDHSVAEIQSLRSRLEQGELHPMEAKHQLASRIVRRLPFRCGCAGGTEPFCPGIPTAEGAPGHAGVPACFRAGSSQGGGPAPPGLAGSFQVAGAKIDRTGRRGDQQQPDRGRQFLPDTHRRAEFRDQGGEATVCALSLSRLSREGNFPPYSTLWSGWLNSRSQEFRGRAGGCRVGLALHQSSGWGGLGCELRTSCCFEFSLGSGNGKRDDERCSKKGEQESGQQPDCNLGLSVLGDRRFRAKGKGSNFYVRFLLRLGKPDAFILLSN